MKASNISKLASLLTLTCVLLPLAQAGPAGSAPNPEETYRTEHFTLTWTGDPDDPDSPSLVDKDDDGIPDSIEVMAEAFEFARVTEIDQLGFKAPPIERRMRLYVARTNRNGYTQEAPGGNGASKPSFVVVPPSLMRADTTFASARSFAVHEYMHAIQNGYNSDAEAWIKEATAAWMEDVAFDDGNHNYNYLFDFVPFPERGLDDSNGVHEYGAFIFFEFLAERYGGGQHQGVPIIRELWEAMAVPEAVPGAPNDGSRAAIERVLAARGVSLEDAWREYLFWEFRIQNYEEGAAYRKVLRFSSWPATQLDLAVPVESCRQETRGFGLGLPPLSGTYTRFVPDDSVAGTSRLTISGPPGSTAFALVKHPKQPPDRRSLTIGADGLAATDISVEADRDVKVIVGLGNTSTSYSMIAYSLRSLEEGTVIPTAPTGPSTTIYGTGTFLSGQVSCVGAPAPSANVLVTQTAVSTGETQTFELQTGPSGSWSLPVFPEVNSTYKVEVVDPLLSAATSGETNIGVRVALSIFVAEDRLAPGENVEIDGNVTPVHEVPINAEYRRPDGEWTLATTSTVPPDGHYTMSFALPGPGIWEIRSNIPDTGDDDHLGNMSVSRFVEVLEP